jgi:hypothetical protein
MYTQYNRYSTPTDRAQLTLNNWDCSSSLIRLISVSFLMSDSNFWSSWPDILMSSIECDIPEGVFFNGLRFGFPESAELVLAATVRRYVSCYDMFVHKGKATSVEAYYGSTVFQEFEAPRFQDSRHMKVGSLSVLRTGRLYPQANIPSTHFCWGARCCSG